MTPPDAYGTRTLAMIAPLCTTTVSPPSSTAIVSPIGPASSPATMARRSDRGPELARRARCRHPQYPAARQEIHGSSDTWRNEPADERAVATHERVLTRKLEQNQRVARETSHLNKVPVLARALPRATLRPEMHTLRREHPHDRRAHIDDHQLATRQDPGEQDPLEQVRRLALHLPDLNPRTRRQRPASRADARACGSLSSAPLPPPRPRTPGPRPGPSRSPLPPRRPRPAAASPGPPPTQYAPISTIDLPRTSLRLRRQTISLFLSRITLPGPAAGCRNRSSQLAMSFRAAPVYRPAAGGRR